MGLQLARVLSVIALSTLASPAAPQSVPPPNSIAGQLSRPWRHVPNPVSDTRFAQDKAKCKMIAAQTPDVDEIKYDVVFLNCLRANGYEPVPVKTQVAEPAEVPAPKPAASGLANIDLIPCSSFRKLRKKNGPLEVQLIMWAYGFMAGWNMASNAAILKIDPTELTSSEQTKFIEAFCDANPSKRYVEAVTALMAKLKYEKSRRTGQAE